MRKGMAWAAALLVLPTSTLSQNPVQAPTTPRAKAAAQNPTERVTLEEAIRLALQHNHALEAMRKTILQNQAQETTANLRPNPVLSWDAQFLPIFEPSKFTADYIDSQGQFDMGVGYLFERGKKRQHRLQAAKDVTVQTRWQVSDSERQLTFNVAQQFISALLAESTLEFWRQRATWTAPFSIRWRSSSLATFPSTRYTAPLDCSSARWRTPWRSRYWERCCLR
jgi:outer membrane protein TolC